MSGEVFTAPALAEELVEEDGDEVPNRRRRALYTDVGGDGEAGDSRLRLKPDGITPCRRRR